MVRSRRSKPYLLFSTVSSSKEAKEIARTLVKHSLAACVNIVSNVQSFFWWQGAFDQAKEYLLIIKTDHIALRQVEKMICKLHSYDVPEIIGWPIVFGHKPYLNWLRKSIS